ncbi:MAG TPA: carboxymuconolactone decarboxylase family protein [Pseudonocardiaceae bacterium]|jgi:AhpD family alkylhydroperoxidase|nr:carboxymuconolactone decarboxylase family protein [Pseudonocardiaceae bacterium]
MSTRRTILSTAFPEAFKQLLGLHEIVTEAATEAGLDPKLIELLKIRSSQLNGCAYCTDMHTRDARKLDETERRLYLLPVWRETDLYTEQERAALALAESMTTLSQTQDVPDEVYQPAAELFSERQLVVLAWATAVINTFNRFGVASRTPLPRAV